METGSGNGQQWGGQRGGGSPSHPSQTPSPAGSVGSEGSQSSGYTTSTEGTRSKASSSAPPVGHTPPHPQPPPGAHGAVSTVSVPANIHSLIIKQNYLSSQLASALDMWMEADEYVAKNNIKGEAVCCVVLCMGLSIVVGVLPAKPCSGLAVAVCLSLPHTLTVPFLSEFFAELDHQASPLTLHSSLPELVLYVQCGLHRIRA